MPKVLRTKIYFTYVYAHTLNVLFDDNATALPQSSSTFAALIHSHSLFIFLRQLIVKVDTKVRRKSHLRAASDVSFALALALALVLGPDPYFNLLFCSTFCWLLEKNLLTFCFCLPYPASTPQWAAWRVNAESYVIIKIILRDCVDFFFGHLLEQSTHCA